MVKKWYKMKRTHITFVAIKKTFEKTALPRNDATRVEIVARSARRSGRVHRDALRFVAIDLSSDSIQTKDRSYFIARTLLEDPLPHVLSTRG